MYLVYIQWWQTTADDSHYQQTILVCVLALPLGHQDLTNLVADYLVPVDLCPGDGQLATQRLERRV